MSKQTDTDQSNKRFICTPKTPWKREYGFPVSHTNCHEVGEQESGWPCGDTVRMRCDDCGATWKEELPQ